jgi:hypothetical protein
MQYHWIRDQVGQRKVTVFWCKGSANVADFFTKALPVHKHQLFKNLLVNSPNDNTVNPSLTKREQKSHANRFAILSTDDYESDTD